MATNQDYNNTFANPPIDYTSRERDAIMVDARKLIAFFLPEWTDHSESDIGIAILETHACFSDVLNFYVDQIAKEGFLPTAVHRRSVGNLLKLIDYQLGSASPSTVDLNFTLSTVAAGDVIIPENYQVSTSSGTSLIFETQNEVTISAGSLTATGVSAKQGVTTVEILTPSNGTAYQEIELTGASIIDDTLRVYVNEGIGDIEWTVYDTLVNSDGTDLHVEYEKDAYDNYKLRFGDNANGKIPINAATIKARYRTGGGVNTNVGAGTITRVLVNLSDSLGNPVTLNVVNPLAATGGSNRQTIANAKIQGPRSLRALYRGVTMDDIETLADNLAGVEKVKAVKAGYNTIYIYIAPSGGGIPSATLLSEVEAEFNNDVGMMCTNHVAQAASYATIEMTAVITVLGAYYQTDVQTSVENEIASFFELTNLEFDQDVRLGDMFAMLETIQGVDSVDIQRLTLTPEPTYLTWSGDGTIGSILIYSGTVAETWTVYFTSPTDYSVTGSVSGFQGVGVADGSTFTAANNFVSFIITAGASPNVLGDNATIRVSPIRESVIVLESEIPKEESGGFTLTYEGGIE